MYVTSKEITRKRLTWVRTELKIKVYPIVRTKEFHRSTRMQVESPKSDEQTANMIATSEKSVTINDLTPSNIGVGGDQMGTNKAASPMRVLSERLVTIYDKVSTEKETEKLSLNELQECPENL